MMKSEKVSYAVFTRNIKEEAPILDFLKNAQKYGHKIEHLIIVYNDYVDEHIVKLFEEYCSVTVIQLGHKFFIFHLLKRLGLKESEIQVLLKTPNLMQYDLVAYGKARNFALITAMCLDMGYLLFFDSDVFPKLLTKYHPQNSMFRDVDFVGTHIKQLKNDDVIVTSSDYSGYYIIPQMDFPELKNLLIGLQKDDQHERIISQNKPVIADSYGINIRETSKVLGGNLGIDLNKKECIPPFFSTNLNVGDQCYLGRGEDTLFAPLIATKGGKCIDVDMVIFHNCFGDYPIKPKCSNTKNIDRFFYACMGWLIRNPFYNWLKHDLQNEELKNDDDTKYKALQIGAKGAAEYFDDTRFLLLPEAFLKSQAKLQENINYYRSLMKVWEKMIYLLTNKSNEII